MFASIGRGIMTSSGGGGKTRVAPGGGSAVKYTAVSQDQEAGHHDSSVEARVKTTKQPKLHHFGLCGVHDSRLSVSMRVHRILLLFVYPILLSILVIAGFYVSVNEHTTCLPVSHYSVVQTNFSSLLGEALGQTTPTASVAPTSSPGTPSPISSSSGSMSDEEVMLDEASSSSGSSIDGSLTDSALNSEYSEEYSLKPGQVIMGSETVPDYYESLEDKLMTLAPTIKQTAAPTLFPTASPTSPTAPTMPTVSPTLAPTIEGEDSGGSGEDEDTYSEVGDGKVSRWTYNDIVTRAGSFADSSVDYMEVFWQGGAKMIQPNDDGYVYLALEHTGTKVSTTSFTECVLEDTAGTGSMTVPCTYVTSPVAAVRMNATEAIQRRKLNVWNVYIANSLFISELMFGKIIMCIGQRNIGMPVKYDLASTGLTSKHDARIHSYRMAYVGSTNDVAGHSWDNTKANIPEVSSACYATAVAYLERFPDTGYIGAVTSTASGITFRNFIPSWINSASNDRGYDRGLSQVRFNGIEILVAQIHEAMSSIANMNNHLDTFFPQFFKTYLSVRHLKTKIALVGANLMSTTMVDVMVQSNELMRSYVDASLRAYGFKATFISVYDLEDPYFRVDQTTTHTADGCADEDETVWPWFLDGWCENQESNRVFDKIGYPRLKGPVGYRTVAQLYINATTSQDAAFYLAPSWTSLTKDNDNSLLLTFDRPVSYSNTTMQPYEIPFRWKGVTGNIYYGYSSGGARIESSDVSVSEDGYVVNITRTDSDYFSISMKSAFFAQRKFACCNDFDDYGTSSADITELVCPPMNCGLNSAEDPYIPVEMFRTNA